MEARDEQCHRFGSSPLGTRINRADDGLSAISEEAIGALDNHAKALVNEPCPTKVGLKGGCKSTITHHASFDRDRGIFF